MADALIQAGAGVAITGRERYRTEAVAAELGGGGVGIGLDVRDERCISMNEQTMTRRGFVPYGPSGAGVEALARVMAADLAGTTVTVNILLPGGATATGMIPDDASPEIRATLLDPAIMGPPIVWLASGEAEGVHDERIIAANFETWLAQR